ncbi:hypothetical protein [Stigmatella aurantiaca]|uniref:hypothetical protein n=1 Tax=Stigmatella aurantiaca TaxID=41 RepID=UPI0011603FB2|nr:hypothetical protein [Stigmatella aurantiaca]
MTTSSKILVLISTLASSRPFAVDTVSRLTGAQLQPAPEVSNEYFTVYRSSKVKDASILKVELRVPTPKTSRKDGLLLFELNPATCVTRNEAQLHFDLIPTLSVPTPHQPPDSPFYLNYTHPWGQVRLGFSQSSRSCLMSVVLDAIG